MKVSSKITASVTTAVLGLALAIPVYADQVALPLDVQDGLENMWSIQKDRRLRNVAPFHYSSGTVADRLRVDDTSFPEQEFATRTVAENGIEIQIGPNVVGPVYVTRKLFFGKGESYVRIMEVIENKSTTPVAIKVSMYSAPYKSTIVWEDESAVVASGNIGVATEFFYGA